MDTEYIIAFHLSYFYVWENVFYNLPWSPQNYNVSGPGIGWLFWKCVAEGISTALKKYLPPPLAVQSLLPHSSLFAELLGTLDGIAANGFFFFFFSPFFAQFQ